MKIFKVLFCGIVFLGEPVCSQDLINTSDLAGRLNESGSIQIIKSEASFEQLIDSAVLINSSDVPLDRDLRWFAPGTYEYESLQGWVAQHPQVAVVIQEMSGRRGFGLPYGVVQKDSWTQLGFNAVLPSDASLGTRRFGYQRAISLLNRYTVLTSWKLFENQKAEEGLRLLFAMMHINKTIADREFLVEKIHAYRALSGLCESARDMMYVYGESADTKMLRRFAYDMFSFFNSSTDVQLPEAEYVIAKEILEGIFDRTAMPNEFFGPELAKQASRKSPLARFGARRFWDLLAKDQLIESGESQVIKMTSVYDEIFRQWREPKTSQMRKLRKSVWELDALNKVRFAPVRILMQGLRDLFEERDLARAEVCSLIISTGLVAYKNKLGKYPDRIKKIYSMVAPKEADIDWVRDDLKGFRYALVGKEGDGDPDLRGGRIRLIAGGGIVFDGEELELPSRGKPLLFSVGFDKIDGNMMVHSKEDVSGADIVMWPPLVGLLRDSNILDQY